MNYTYKYILTATAAGDEGEWETICAFDHDPNEEEIVEAIKEHVSETVEDADEKDKEAFVDAYFDGFNGGAIEVKKVKVKE